MSIMCQGICTSQADDYCGMHLPGESCIACASTWEEAHREKEQREQERV